MRFAYCVESVTTLERDFVTATRHAFVAATRFGMGATPGELDRIGNDPRAWLVDQLRPQPIPALLAQMAGTSALYERFREVQAARKEAAKAANVAQANSAQANSAQPGVTTVTPPPANGAAVRNGRGALAVAPGQPPQRPIGAQATPAAAVTPQPVMGQPLRQIYLDESAARTRVAAATTTPLYERLVQFWSNHFTVSVVRPPVLPIAGAFEREAIRPHVTGSFHDMLRAVAMHPA